MSIRHAEEHAEEIVVTGSGEAVARGRHTALAGTPLLVLGVALAASNLRPAVTLSLIHI